MVDRAGLSAQGGCAEEAQNQSDPRLLVDLGRIELPSAGCKPAALPLSYRPSSKFFYIRAPKRVPTVASRNPL